MGIFGFLVGMYGYDEGFVDYEGMGVLRVKLVVVSEECCVRVCLKVFLMLWMIGMWLD